MPDDLLSRLRTHRGTAWRNEEEAAIEIERLRAIVDPIDVLRKNEGDAVTIVCDNPEFDGPANAVLASGNWSGFAERRYLADSLAGALASAVKDREASEAAKAEGK